MQLATVQTAEGGLEIHITHTGIGMADDDRLLVMARFGPVVSA